MLYVLLLLPFIKTEGDSINSDDQLPLQSSLSSSNNYKYLNLITNFTSSDTLTSGERDEAIRKHYKGCLIWLLGSWMWARP